MSAQVDAGLPPRQNRAVVVGLLIALISAAVFGSWFVVHEGARARGSATSGGSSADPMVRGEQVYGLCANCHGLGGGGQLGRAPALLGSKWLAPPTLTRLVMHGFQGDDPKRYLERMVGAPALSDADTAALVTFVLARYSGREDVTTAAEVSAVRAATRGRTRPWTIPELRMLAPEAAGDGE